jgi:hypothetical protein
MDLGDLLRNLYSTSAEDLYNHPHKQIISHVVEQIDIAYFYFTEIGLLQQL